MQYSYHENLTNLDETGFGLICVDRPNSFAPSHWHQAVEILLFVQGEVNCKFSHSTVVAKPGDVLVINSHDIHETRCTHNARYLVVHILPSIMCRYMPDFDRLHFSLKFDPDDPVKSSALAQFRQHMEQILDIYQSQSLTGQLDIHARLFALTSILVEYFSDSNHAEEHNQIRSDRKRLEPLLEYIQVNHPQPLPLDSAAEYLGLNREYFCRLFKKNMGVSYVTYLNQVRAAAVCRELEVSEDPIGEISERHGFTSTKMLNQYFRELYGCSPSEKRRAFREMILDGVY